MPLLADLVPDRGRFLRPTVVARCKSLSSVGREHDHRGLSVVQGTLLHFFRGQGKMLMILGWCDIPETNRPVPASTDDRNARRERDGENVVLVSLKTGQFDRVSDTPEANGPVCASGEEKGAIGRKRYAGDRTGVPFKNAHWSVP